MDGGRSFTTPSVPFRDGISELCTLPEPWRLAFCCFLAAGFGADADEKKLISYLAVALAIPMVVSGYTAIGFFNLINSGTLPEMGGLTTWASFQEQRPLPETWWFGVHCWSQPLAASFGMG